ncbi:MULTISPECIES: hypothetical protein [Delftia]|jgi:hypothetical protein|uniref:hypothetical protein n=1 Tax=Delftia TaxID=80865 RepID=UPI0010568AFE|nr:MULTISPECIES: hypothetical protein [Delftia]MDH1827015.1 hypothetical protein [Delftia tsuruhatensis]TDF27238.1 hypothetical protein EZI45_16645 [Delftia tsuruhatensis]
MSGMEMVISSDLVRARAEITALNQSLAAARTEIATVDNRVQWVSSQVANTGAVKSVQRGVVSMSGETPSGSNPVIVNVSPVTMERASLHFIGGAAFVSNGYGRFAYAKLINSSQIQFDWGNQVINATNILVSWELVEYK